MTSQKICILIIDSDKESVNRTIETLQSSPLVSKVESVENTNQAILRIITYSPDIILLDYPSRGDAEKELIGFVKNKLPETSLILASKSKKHAAFAIQNGIFKFLLKPIIPTELMKIIHSVHQTKHSYSQSQINKMIDSTPEEGRIRIQTTKGYLIINPDELICCKSAGVYTELYLTRNRLELSSQYLLKFEEMLVNFNFLRVSRTNLINQRFIRKIYKSNNTIVLTSDGKEYEIKAGKIHIKKLSRFDTEL